MFRRLGGAVTAVAALAASAVLMAPSAAADPEPTPGYTQMGPAPEGANEWECKPSPAHPDPVVLVHGTGQSMTKSWNVISPALKAEGYCVFALNYGAVPVLFDPTRIVWGVSDIRESARELATFVDSVLSHTGASKVDLVGHSQGGVVSRQYLKFEGGSNPNPALNKVNRVVALGPTNHGTTFNGQQQMYATLAKFGLTTDIIDWIFLGIAGKQQLVGSRLLTDLNATTEIQPGIQYTVIATKDDEVITPPEGSFLSAATNEVQNIWVQDGCATLGQVGHDGLLRQPRPIWLVQAALDPTYPERHPEPCA